MLSWLLSNTYTAQQTTTQKWEKHRFLLRNSFNVPLQVQAMTYTKLLKLCSASLTRKKYDFSLQSQLL